jgi:hypothetical protein
MGCRLKECPVLGDLWNWNGYWELTQIRKSCPALNTPAIRGQGVTLGRQTI